jgi:hypothetical protein
MSPKAAVTLLIGADPKNPAKKRVTKIEDASLLTPVAIQKRAWQNTGGRILTLRPHISDMGAQIMGPSIKPSLRCEISIVLSSGIAGFLHI